MKTLLGIFEAHAAVGEVIEKLKANGLDAKDFSIVMRDTHKSFSPEDDRSEIGETAIAGVTTGAAVGGIVGFFAGTLFPSLAGFFIAGPIGPLLGLSGAAAATVSGVASGALAGGLIGALRGFGLSHEEAARYERRIRDGAILLIVPAIESKISFVESVFNEYNASDIRKLDVMTDISNRRLKERQSRSQSHQHNQYYATVGMKGGKSSDKRNGKKM